MIVGEAEARAWLETLPEWDALAAERLSTLLEQLTIENGSQNLVSAGSLQDYWVRHVVDSAQLLRFAPRSPDPWFDLGTGAGFPGLVCAILRPDCDFVLVESRGRRVDWLRRVIAELQLKNVVIEGQALERVATRTAGIISARAFAPLPKLLQLATRFSTDATMWLLPKGRSARQELAMIDSRTHMFHVEHSLTDADAGIIVGQLKATDGSAA